MTDSTPPTTTTTPPPTVTDGTTTTSSNKEDVVEAIRIDGKQIAITIQNELQNELQKDIYKQHNIQQPGLAVILVGSRTDSMTYVRNKKKIATEIGLYSLDIQLVDTITETELLQQIHDLNINSKIHGILIQLPLPSHINESTILKAIAVEKDADGFSAWNIGNLCLKDGQPPLSIPCTPAGCIELLQRYNIPIAGKECVVLGRSNIVGMPIAALLQSCNGTVTVCHSQTQNIQQHIKRADILICALGKSEYVHGDWCKQGVVIIDVGINSKPDTSKKRGYRLVGDCHYESCCQIASHITPVPGGVGPMTIIMLMKNTINLARYSKGLSRLPLRRTTN